MKSTFKIKSLKLMAILLLFFTFVSCDNADKPSEMDENMEEITTPFEISLAQWSLHKSFFGDLGNDWAWFGKMLMESPDSLLRGELDPVDFPSIAADYGFETIELVNTFYYSKAKDMAFWDDFKKRCEDAGVKVGLIMCDALGDLGNADEEARNKAVENHYPWVDVAAYLGAHTIRVNAAGAGTADEVATNAIQGLSKLGEYGASKGINIVVENHGGYSSDGSWLSGVMKEVGMDNVGTLPDFGNFCIERNEDFTCKNEYDKYKGMEELMPYAKGVSAKAHDFDEDGNETHSDFARIMQIVKDSGFEGQVGIEYEGSDLSEDDGIKATKALLEKVMKEL
jgi:sugar phosphate isomerase/epimerase